MFCDKYDREYAQIDFNSNALKKKQRVDNDKQQI